MRNRKADDKTLNTIADKHKATAGQILKRWCLQRRWVSLPKSDTPSRIGANIDVYGLELRDEEINTLDDLDEGEAGSVVMTVKN